MLSMTLKCQVPDNRTITLKLPDTVQPGEHELVLVVDDASALVTATEMRRPGSAKGRLVILAEDEQHLDDFQDYMPEGLASQRPSSSCS
jgi:hypothetical protein